MEILRYLKKKGWGFLLGIFGSLSSIFTFYLYKFSYFKFNDVLNLMFHEKSLLSSLLSINMVINILLFSLLTNFRKYNTAIGLFIYTLLVGVSALLFKFVF